MINFTKYKVILWDFDGVLMDSMPVRDKGFEIVLSSYPKSEVEELLLFHRQNGGLSRYIKFRYFFEKLRKETITEMQVRTLSEEFSQVMRKELLNGELLIQDSISFVKENYQKYKMHIVSGSDQEELRFICSNHKIDHYFKSIHGSPTPKDELIKEILLRNDYAPSECVLIGDSKNDYEAAQLNQIFFMGYNNPGLMNSSHAYIENFYSLTR